MAEDDHRGREHDRRPAPSGGAVRRGCRPTRASAARATRDAPGPRPRPADEHDAERQRDQATADERHGRADRRRQHEQHGDRRARPARPARRCAPRRPRAAPRPTSRTSRPWLTPRWTSPSDAARQREVEEQRPVVGRDGGRQRQADAEAAGDDRPPPRTANVVTRPMAAATRSARPSTARTPSRNGPVPRRQTTAASTSAAAARRNDRRDAPHGSTNRSACPTVTASRPAAASRRRLRR